MATINVTKEKCQKCLYGYPCNMWNELSTPMEGEICDNYEDKPFEIEIPYGAKDSELIEETITIPQGCHAIIEGNKVVIHKGEKTDEWHIEDEQNLNAVLSYIPDECLRKWLKGIIHLRHS